MDVGNSELVDFYEGELIINELDEVVTDSIDEEVIDMNDIDLNVLLFRGV